MPNFRMTLSYDGTRYNGWQRQGNTPDTIQGRLETALSALLEQPVEVAGSGRTDAGVHARMQTASFRAKTNLPAPELLRRLRARLPGDIGVLTLEETAPRFHARLSCRGKTYVYERVRAPLCLGPAAAARHGGHAARGGAAVRSA